MHPLGLYLVSKDIQREHRWDADDDRRAATARVDAKPAAKSERPSRIGRLVAIVRRQVVRAAGA